jgi:hypothetical protein
MAGPDRLDPPPLNLQPSGLLGLFGIKNGGRYPQHLLAELAPQVELLRWYVTANARRYYGQVTPAVTSAWALQTIGSLEPEPILGSSTVLAVPTGEVWVLSDWSATVIHAASGDRGEVAFAVQRGSPNYSSRLLPSTITGTLRDQFDTVAGSITHSGVRPLEFLYPGERLVFVLQRFLSGTLVNYSFDLARLVI